MDTNQSMESTSTVKTPGAIPNQAMTIDTIKGKRIAPARGVATTNQRNIELVGKKFLNQNHSS